MKFIQARNTYPLPFQVDKNFDASPEGGVCGDEERGEIHSASFQHENQTVAEDPFAQARKTRLLTQVTTLPASSPVEGIRRTHGTFHLGRTT